MTSSFPDLSAFYKHVDDNTQLYIDRLGEAVAIPSVSSNLEKHFDDVLEMMKFTQKHVERLGGSSELRRNPAGNQLPPILLANFPSKDPNALTLCVYGHLDVQPAQKSDGWDTEPFTLTEKEGKLYGRGSTDDKGPALSWLWVIEAFHNLNMDLPMNIKLMYEGLEESGSDGLFELIHEIKYEFLKDVDFFCISDNYWLGPTKPCLTYGLRGMSYFEVSIRSAAQDLHSGVFGGTVHESMTDLIHLMSKLVTPNGEILVDGIMDDVLPVTEKEIAMYNDIDFDIDVYKKDSGVANVSNKLLYDNKHDVLMHRWRYPTLSLHGIEGAFSDPGAKTVIPACVKGKFSLRLVPDQDPAKISELVKNYLDKQFRTLNSPNKMEVKAYHGAKAWLSDVNHPNYQAGARAIERVFGTTPDFTREGGSIPIATWLEDATQMNVLLIPTGACDDMAHSQNEKYNVSNYINGIKVLGTYVCELASTDIVGGKKPSECRCEPLTEDELMVPGAFIRGFKCKCAI